MRISPNNCGTQDFQPRNRALVRIWIGYACLAITHLTKEIKTSCLCCCVLTKHRDRELLGDLFFCKLSLISVPVAGSDRLGIVDDCPVALFEILSSIMQRDDTLSGGLPCYFSFSSHDGLQ